MTPVMAMSPGSVLRVSTDLMLSTPVSSVWICSRSGSGGGGVAGKERGGLDADVYGGQREA